MDVNRPKTLDRWTLFLGSITAGVHLEEAMLHHRLTSSDIEAYVLDPEQRARWHEARIAARKRKWSVLQLEEIFAKISAGDSAVAAVEAVTGNIGSFSSFTDLCASDPELNTHYLRAMKSRALIESDKLFSIADGDGKGDYLDNGKGGRIPDNAKVNRDKLRADTRLRLMSSWYRKLFGEKEAPQVNVQIINHAQRLAEARQRRDTRQVVPRVSHEVIEAAFSEVPTLEQDMSWDDLPKGEGVSTIWQEGK